MSEDPGPTGSRGALDDELTTLRERMIALGEGVQAALSSALQALRQGDRDIAASIIAEDSELNEMRFAVERIGTEAIATQQPAAKDLRAIVAVMSMVVDLERMGDHAAGIAKTVMAENSSRLTAFKTVTEVGMLARSIKTMTSASALTEILKKK